MYYVNKCKLSSGKLAKWVLSYISQVRGSNPITVLIFSLHCLFASLPELFLYSLVYITTGIHEKTHGDFGATS